MSITFLPAAGVVQVPSYYCGETDSVSVYFNEHPSIQCHNSGGMAVLEYLELPEEYCGQAEAEDIDRMLGIVHRMDPTTPYLQDKLHALEQMLLHCKHHQCGFGWG